MNYYKESLAVLKRLHTKYPSFSLGRHIDTATSDYGGMWSMTDKEMLHSLEKYEAELELDHTTSTHEKYVEDIVEDADHLNIDDGEE